MHYIIIDTGLGEMGLVGSGDGLRRIILSPPSPGAVQELIVRCFPGAAADPNPFGDLPSRLGRYLNGEQVPFNDKLDLNDASAFKRAVWIAARAIPYGQTRSYGWIARQIGNPGALRAVGQALAKNPVPIVVPCHRVIGRDGSLTGFEGGLEMKRRLLEIEASSR